MFGLMKTSTHDAEVKKLKDRVSQLEAEISENHLVLEAQRNAYSNARNELASKELVASELLDMFLTTKTILRKSEREEITKTLKQLAGE